MQHRDDIHDMRLDAYHSQGWTEEGEYNPDADLSGEDAAYYEGVESALLWVLGEAGEPLPR